MACSLGDTIESLQSRIGYREYLTWVAYRKKYGPLNPVRMYDQSNALIATQINNAHGGKAKPIDFMPYAPQREEEKQNDNSVEFISALSKAKGVKIGR